jgi:hypothetical protein
MALVDGLDLNHVSFIINNNCGLVLCQPAINKVKNKTMKKITLFFLQSRWRYTLHTGIIFAFGSFLLNLIWPEQGASRQHIGMCVTGLLVGYFIYPTVKKMAVKRHGSEAPTMRQLFTGSKTLAIALGASVGVLLSVIAFAVYRPLNIFIAMPVAAALFGLLGHVVYLNLKKKQAP